MESDLRCLLSFCFFYAASGSYIAKTGIVPEGVAVGATEREFRQASLLLAEILVFLDAFFPYGVFREDIRVAVR